MNTKEDIRTENARTGYGAKWKESYIYIYIYEEVIMKCYDEMKSAEVKQAQV
jgi:hypothetical protein